MQFAPIIDFEHGIFFDPLRGRIELLFVGALPQLVRRNLSHRIIDKSLHNLRLLLGHWWFVDESGKKLFDVA
jgi:hypothetical protein